MADQIQPPTLHDLLRWWPRPEPGDPALFVLVDLLKENPRALREIATVQLELSKEVHAAQIKAIDRALGIVSQIQ
jgi:hypothetical protein